MHITALSQDAWTVLLSYLQTRHYIRLFTTGDIGVQHRIIHSPLVCDSSHMADVYGGCLRNVIMPNAVSLTTVGAQRMKLDVIDFSSFHKLKSLHIALHDRYCAFVLAPYLTSLSLVVYQELRFDAGHFGEMAHLHTLSFVSEADWMCLEKLAAKDMVWPPNLTDLTIKYGVRSRKALDASVGSDIVNIKFPPTLVKLELDVTPSGWSSSMCIDQCQQLEVLKLGGNRTTVFDIKWFHLPNLKWVECAPCYNLEKNFAALPPTVTYLDVRFRLASRSTTGVEVVNAMKMVLPRLVFKSAERMMTNACVFFCDRDLPLDLLMPLVQEMTNLHKIQDGLLSSFYELPKDITWQWRKRTLDLLDKMSATQARDFFSNHAYLFESCQFSVAQTSAGLEESLNFTRAVSRDWCRTWYLDRDVTPDVSADELACARRNVEKLVIFGDVSVDALGQILSAPMPRLRSIKFVSDRPQVDAPSVLEQCQHNLTTMERVNFGYSILAVMRIMGRLEARARFAKCDVFEYRVVPVPDNERLTFRIKKT